jgi:TPP-dependent pyruvate/acetoin dehydrogenase alpha subunit
MPFSEASKVKDIADHAFGYGIPGEVVNGMDVQEVHKSVQKAIKKAREGKGPSIIECKTYRYLVHYSRGKQGLISGHVEYRPEKEIKEWEEKDPIKNTRQLLIEKGILTEEKNNKIENEINDVLEKAIEFAEKSQFPEGYEALEDVFSS